ncbi:MAG TPA: choice-of-anchor V domain-containing protein, partial [Candidatus Poseidoniales archaeon]|nr:choice-of-anchor V domain-containing protein [Candidatus Poseidoniales archaeon]
MARSAGIAGEVDYNGDVSEVTMAGCQCHAEDPSDDVTVLLDGVPYAYTPGTTYSLTLQVVGGPDRGSGGTSQAAGFSMRTTLGLLTPADGNTQNWDGDTTRLTHTSAGSSYSNAERIWSFDWVAPETDQGTNRF